MTELARYEPEIRYVGTGEYVAECVRADGGDYYLAADVDAAIEALRAENARLRDEALLRQALDALERMVRTTGDTLEITGVVTHPSLTAARAAIAALRERLGKGMEQKA